MANFSINETSINTGEAILPNGQLTVDPELNTLFTRYMVANAGNPSGSARIVPLIDIPRADFSNVGGRSPEHSILDNPIIRTAADTFQMLSNISYQGRNGGDSTSLGGINLLKAERVSANGQTESVNMVFMAGTELFEQNQGNDFDDYIDTLLSKDNTYLQGLWGVLEDIDRNRSSDANEKVYIYAHSAAGLALLSDKGRALIEKAKHELGVEIEHISTFGAPFKGAQGRNLAGVLESTGTEVDRFMYPGDWITGVSPELIWPWNEIRNSAGAHQPLVADTQIQANPIKAHGAYANGDPLTGFGHLDADGNQLNSDQAVTYRVISDSVRSYDIPEELNSQNPYHIVTSESVDTSVTSPNNGSHSLGDPLTAQTNNPGNIDWTQHYQMTVGNPPPDLLLEGLSQYARSGQSPGQAIDIGSGAGVATRAFLDRGWQVLAIDSDPNAAVYTEGYTPAEQRDRLQMLITPLQDAELVPADFIFAMSTLPYVPAEDFSAIWVKIENAIQPGGVFVGNFFLPGHRLANDPNANVHTMTIDEVAALFEGYEILGVRQDAETVDVIVRKPLSP